MSGVLTNAQRAQNLLGWLAHRQVPPDVRGVVEAAARKLLEPPDIELADRRLLAQAAIELLAAVSTIERQHGQLSVVLLRLEKLRDVETELAKAYRWIALHTPEGWGDHGCAQCRPNSELVLVGFVCAVHAALAWLEAHPEHAKP